MSRSEKIVRATGAVLSDGVLTDEGSYRIDAVNSLSLVDRDGVKMITLHHGPTATTIRLSPDAAVWLKDRL